MCIAGEGTDSTVGEGVEVLLSPRKSALMSIFGLGGAGEVETVVGVGATDVEVDVANEEPPAAAPIFPFVGSVLAVALMEPKEGTIRECIAAGGCPDGDGDGACLSLTRSLTVPKLSPTQQDEAKETEEIQEEAYLVLERPSAYSPSRCRRLHAVTIV